MILLSALNHGILAFPKIYLISRYYCLNRQYRLDVPLRITVKIFINIKCLCINKDKTFPFWIISTSHVGRMVTIVLYHTQWLMRWACNKVCRYAYFTILNTVLSHCQIAINVLDISYNESICIQFFSKILIIFCLRRDFRGFWLFLRPCRCQRYPWSFSSILIRGHPPLALNPTISYIPLSMSIWA